VDAIFRHILVPIDGSEPSSQAIDVALRIIAMSPGARLTVLHVVDKLVLAELARFSKKADHDIESELAEQGRRYMEFASEKANAMGITADCEIRKGDPFEEILAAANSRKADLIVMGHTGRRGTTRVLLGSVTERVLDYAPCPVLVVK
jgi:nucleotide-binding universal stress UspA family protein